MPCRRGHALLIAAVAVVASACDGGTVPAPESAAPPRADAPAVSAVERDWPADAAEWPECTAAQHDRHVTTGPDGRTYPTWHPPVDVEARCRHTHEHGSNPRLFPAFDAVGMPPFGYAIAQAGESEPHPGFKVYAVDDVDAGLHWLVTFHMGTAGAARAFRHLHSVHVTVAEQRTRRLLANVHLLTETGMSQKGCILDRARIPGSGPDQHGEGILKSVPALPCPPRPGGPHAAHGDVYESWATRARIPGLFEFRVTYDVDNAQRAVACDSGACSPVRSIDVRAHTCDNQPGSPGCDRQGDKRGFLQPRLVLTNASADSIVVTRPDGTPSPDGTGIRQFVRANTTLRHESREAFTNFANPGEPRHTGRYRARRFCEPGTFCGPINHSPRVSGAN
ncbi:MAG: hypothetical protein MUF21_04085 [Gemmatimonadaceae bacterium]|jgi:hypothetical protein|nr:hypothetical protein [Gemmatimonadaceae bacterium]